MKTYILLLRGINVGGKNILPMKELTALLEANGFKKVQTYIQSGNIVLESRNISARKIKDMYLHAPDGIARSKFAANVEVCLGTSTTGRNLNTVNKLAEMVQSV